MAVSTSDLGPTPTSSVEMSLRPSLDFIDPYHIRDNLDGIYHTEPEVIEEVIDLRARGYNVSFVAPDDPHRLSPIGQKLVDELIAELEGNPDGKGIFESFDAMQIWTKHTMRAIALGPLYQAGTAERLGEGIASDAYRKPIFSRSGEKDLLSAAQYMERDKPTRWESIVTKYETFVETPIDEMSRLFYRGSLDARAVRTRAYTAANMIVTYFDSEQPNDDHELVIASVACGAAGPMCETAEELEDAGHNVGRMYLLDQDVMALASGFSLMESKGLSEKASLVVINLMTGRLSESIEEGSVDVADILGLFEYFDNKTTVRELFAALKVDIEHIPEDERDLGLASALLRQVGKLMRPGGIIVFGNMLKHRQQNKFFSDIVGWPQLQNRSIEEVMEIVEQAGFDPADMLVQIPAEEGLYAVYGLGIPSESHTGSDNKVTVTRLPQVGKTALKAAA